MKASPKTIPHATDMVAMIIEHHLRAMEKAGHGKLAVTQENRGFKVTFGAHTVRGEDYDIALVRLASLLLEDERMSKVLCARLRHSQIADATRHESAVAMLR